MSPACFGDPGRRFRIAADGTLAIGGTVFRFVDAADAPAPGTEVHFTVLPHGFVCTTAAAFNASLSLPFDWEPGHRVVLSGLSASSAGNGMNRASVVHVTTTTAFALGRLRRSAGQFLCSTHVDAYGSDAGMRRAAGARVTCRSCLAQADRLRGARGPFKEPSPDATPAASQETPDAG
ncbi:hypothetical protein BHAOGJBA_4206 [Methylobacterium hispanicum]|uniref:Uncharacterized protein n=1 Tax=Methylobacterium hispanicum TaxID=270350 RepID=A0AAV4ZQ59_9HYPH|nr:hypothetical protein [Methylobacterium hispanicum]GJD90664.1 hypothetical protein BHAOGJBA_4206 [Methylobacterium hispanicum]